jgi:WD40 repeat protein
VYCLRVLTKDLFASGTRSGRISIWNIRTGKCEKQLLGHTLWIVGLELTPSSTSNPINQQLISCSTDKTIRIWNVFLSDGNESCCARILSGHNGWINCIKFNNKGELISGSDDKCLRVWDVNTGVCLRTITTESTVYSLEFCSIF